MSYNIATIIAEHLDQIRSMFSVPVKLTIIIRSDNMPDDTIITDDNLDEVVATIMRGGGGELH